MSRTGNVRLSNFYKRSSFISSAVRRPSSQAGGNFMSSSSSSSWDSKSRVRLAKDIAAIILTRTSGMTNVVELGSYKIVYRRYASLNFIIGTSVEEGMNGPAANELILLDVIHHFVVTLDAYFGSVSSYFEYVMRFSHWLCGAW